ncbi:hypothetical protein [Flavobacterium nackdongense]|uniref:Signal peptidase n=1 Tax=Flavobacterium nackdongense TaxID=2547394 RepID=A0A4P6Y9P6_9FLAO|nr:hypothetical protein [Flavobacterium nackdongense]QBN19781.1 hypothetical protein E1750_13535 [Flavobacterium nackdongense]
MKNILLKYCIAVVFFCSTFFAFAQPGNNDTGGGLESSDPPAPIDDYLWVLALVGLFFVFMKFRAMHSKKIQG